MAAWINKKHLGQFSGLVVLLVCLVILPFIGIGTFYVKLTTEILIFGLLAMSLDILLGYTGLLSFMHNAYLGIAAYAAGLFLLHVTSTSVWPALLIGIVAAALIGLVVGLISVRTGGLPFALLSIAFGMMFYTLVWKMENITGGSDGLMGVPLPDISIAGLSFGNSGDPTTMYLFTLAVVIVCYLVTRRIVYSPFGAVLEAIRENEERASFVGYNVQRYKLYGWLVACALAGVSGGLFILYKGYIAPPTMGIFEGAIVVIMLLLGGVHSLWGAFVGAAIYIFFADYISTMTPYWKAFVGLIVILLVLFLPRGVVSISDKIVQRQQRQGG